MKNPKVLTAIVLAVLVLVVFFQNRETVETKILFFTVTSSRAATLFLTFLAGAVIGGTLVGIRKRRSAKG